MSDVITITVSGPTRSGKTDVMALIAEAFSTITALNLEGLDIRLEEFNHRVRDPDTHARVGARCASGRLTIVLVEKNTPRPALELNVAAISASCSYYKVCPTPIRCRANGCLYGPAVR